MRRLGPEVGSLGLVDGFPGRPTACGAGHQRAERSTSHIGGGGMKDVGLVRVPVSGLSRPCSAAVTRAAARTKPGRGEPRRGPGPRSRVDVPDPDGAIGEDRSTRAGAVRRRAGRPLERARASPGLRGRRDAGDQWCGASGAARRAASELRGGVQSRPGVGGPLRGGRARTPEGREEKTLGKPGPDVGALASRRMRSTLRRRSARRDCQHRGCGASLRGLRSIHPEAPGSMIANLEEGSSIPDELGECRVRGLCRDPRPGVARDGAGGEALALGGVRGRRAGARVSDARPATGPWALAGVPHDGRRRDARVGESPRLTTAPEAAGVMPPSQRGSSVRR